MDIKSRLLAWWRWLVPIGFGAQAGAVVLYSLYERRIIGGNSGLPATLFLLATLPTLLHGGMLLAAVAGTIWAWQTRPGIGLAVGGSLILASWACSALITARVEINVHGWSGWILFPILCLFCLGLAFAIIPSARLLYRRLS